MSESRRLPTPGIILFLLAAAAAAAQPRTEPSGSSMRLGLRVDYFSQRVGWDNPGGESTSDLNSALVAAALQFRLGRDSSATILAGYGSSDFGGLMFRALPFSIDYQAGGVGGLALGAEFDLAVATGSGIRVSVQGEALA